ncbi:hypothetical protein ACUTR7_00385 [Delftia sp. NA_296.1]|uniref:hypothetical protein n=1 Tax=Delftia sp. NA_296.1 TaxID=3415648 RepID=UPI004046625F
MSKTETQSEALRLAETLEIYGHRGTQKAAAELRRLDARVKSLEFAFNEWHDKTDWVQETAQALELGMHRADVLRARIEALDAANKALRADAERYRWLRDFHNGPDGVKSQFPYIAAGDDEEFAWAFSGVTADAAIDAAMAAAKNGGAA